jgi:hypothetical protein
MQKQVISGHLQAAGVGIFNGVLGGPAEGVWTCSAGGLAAHMQGIAVLAGHQNL